LDEAFAIANGTQYALTAGFFSRSPANITRAYGELEAATFTSIAPSRAHSSRAIPSVDTKCPAAAPRPGEAIYLQNFLFPRVVTENRMRRGFADAPGTPDQPSEGE
jgi:RHH-type proline utilization regulon transcriptional repressor/proline dehydrogenase/delta 1-pyrroline-5-carboxylate dehydrogenase